MTKHVTIDEAEAELSALIEAALAGEEIVIAKSGKPLVKLTPVVEKPKEPLLGYLKRRGYHHDIPYEVFAPEPEDAEEPRILPEEWEDRR